MTCFMSKIAMYLNKKWPCICNVFFILKYRKAMFCIWFGRVVFVFVPKMCIWTQPWLQQLISLGAPALSNPRGSQCSPAWSFSSQYPNVALILWPQLFQWLTWCPGVSPDSEYCSTWSHTGYTCSWRHTYGSSQGKAFSVNVYTSIPVCCWLSCYLLVCICNVLYYLFVCICNVSYLLYSVHGCVYGLIVCLGQ